MKLFLYILSYVVLLLHVSSQFFVLQHFISVTDQESHSYETTGKITVLYR
jgi:hypothetical protein